MRSLSLIVLICFPFSAAAQDDTPVGGVGRFACSEIIGPQNAPYLGQVADWALGYLAGRIDAGQEPTEDSALSPADALDVVTGIAVRCRETPDAAVIDAVRDYAENILGEPAQGGDVVADPPAPPPDMPTPPGTSAPPPRPESFADMATEESDAGDAAEVDAPDTDETEEESDDAAQDDAAEDETSSDGTETDDG